MLDAVEIHLRYLPSISGTDSLLAVCMPKTTNKQRNKKRKGRKSNLIRS